MGTPLAVGQLIRARIVSYLAPQLGEVTTHWQVADVVGGTVQDEDFALELNTRIHVQWKALTASASTYYGVGVQIFAPREYREIQDKTYSGPGALTGAPLPTQVRGLITLRTSFSGRAFRGRAYPPFPTVDDIVAGTGYPNVSYTTALQALADALFVPLVATRSVDSALVIPVIYHKAANKAGTTTAGSATAITEALARSTFATQRRSGELGRTNPPPF